MTVFGMGDRGKFFYTTVDTAEGQGIQITLPGESPLDESSIVTSFSVEQHENFSVTQCLNGGVHLYTFGHDPQNSQFGLGISTFVNTCAGQTAPGLAKALRAYEEGRVSRSKDIASMSVGDSLLQGYLIGQRAQVVDTTVGIIAVTYTFAALNTQSGGKTW